MITTATYGLSVKDLSLITEVFKEFSSIKEVRIYGSRAIGNYKKASDIDISIIGENIDNTIIARVYNILNEEIPLPYFFDVNHYNSLENQALKEHIDIEGKTIYKV